MKIFYFAISAFCLMFFYSSFRQYKEDLRKLINEITPTRYSEDEKSTRTVTILPVPRKASTTEKIIPVPNTQFNYSPGPFSIDDSEDLKKIGLSCTPESFGYTVDKGKQVFPDYTFPKCSVKNKQNGSYIHIDRPSNTLYMDCPGGENSKYMTGPIDDRKIVRSMEVYFDWKVEDYKSPVSAKDVEFALGTCEKDEVFTQAALVPIFKEKAFTSAVKKVKGRPRIIYFLTLDSMSRRHFFRKMPRVIDFLNKLNEKDSNYSVFDFKLHNILGPDSVGNQIPILGGLENFVREFKGNQNIDKLGKNALWSILREKGYVSLFGLENCDSAFPGALGRNPDADYTVGPMFCAVEKYSGLKFGKKFGLVQRCLGGHQTHYYMLNYTKAFSILNRGANLLIYNHLNAAHETTGQHAATFNDDIAEFLEDFLTTFEDEYDIWIYLHADHGMRYGNWFEDTDAYQENKLPSLFIISSKNILKEFPYSYFALSTNAERLTSKLDLRATTLRLAGVNNTEKNSISLLEEVAGKSRTCAECKIDAWDCACNPMEVIYKPCTDIQRVIDSLVGYTERIINSMSYADPRFPPGKHCKKIEISEVTKIYHISINNVNEFFKLEMSSDTQKGMRFQVNFFLHSDKRVDIYKIGYSHEGILYSGQVMVKITGISRLDTYAGPCEVKSRNNKIKPEFCACVD